MTRETIADAPPARRSVGPLRTLALAALWLGALGTLITLFKVAHRQQSSVLLILFVLWDLAPFVVLALGDRASSSWRFRPRVALHVATLLVTLGTLVVYSIVAFGRPRAQPAAAFLLVPPASVLVAAVIVMMTAGPSARVRHKES